jgi:GMP synthase-like glutamine amidotransferase
MRVHYLQHVPFEGLGSIGPWLHARGAIVRATKLYDGETPPAPRDFDWLIVMGGPMSIHDEHAYPWLAAEKRCIADAIAASKTVLGICLGAQLIANALGQRVFANHEAEIGWFPVRPPEQPAGGHFATAFSQPIEVFHWHGQTFDLPAGAVHLAQSDACRNQAFCVGDRVLARQFHLQTPPESAKALAEHCGDELVAAPFVQTAAEILGEATRFERINASMGAVLELLAERCA